MNKTYLYSAIISALVLTNVSTSHADTSNIKIKEGVKTEIKDSVINTQAPLIKASKTILDNAVVEHVPDGVSDAVQDLDEGQLADQAGIETPDVKPNTSISNPGGGDDLDIGSKNNSYTDPATGKSVPLRGSRRFTNPLTGETLLGGEPSDESASPQDQARAAASAGRGRASDDTSDENVTNNTKVYGNITYQQAVVAGIKRSSGNRETTVKILDTPNKTVRIDSSSDSEWVRVRVKKTDRDGNVTYESTTYEDGKKTPKTIFSNKPAPERTSTPNLSKAEKQAAKAKIKKKKLQIQGRESYEDNGSNNQAINNGRGNLTDLDLAGQPRPDDNGVSDSANVGNIQDGGLLMSGQPTEEDDNFGSVGGQFSGVGVANKNVSDKIKQHTVSGVSQDIDVPKGDK